MRSMRLVMVTMLMLLTFSLQTAARAADTSTYKLAYVAYDTNYLSTINPDGTDAQPITQDSVDTQGLVASPDGKYLAYYVDSRNDTLNYLIYHVVVVLDVATGQERKITEQEAIVGLAWSPDSQQLLFAVLTHHDDGTIGYALTSMKRDGSDRKVLHEGTNSVSGLSWSPDSQHILLAGQAEQFAYQIVTLAADGSQPHLVVNIASCFICAVPQWTPDSQHIIFYKHPDLFIMDADGQNLRQLTDFAQIYNVTDVAYARYGSPSFSISSDSQSLYYTMGYPLQIVKLDLGENSWTNRAILYDDQTHIIAGNQVSSDGKLLFFSTDNRDGSLLSSLDLATHAVQVLAKNVSQPVFITAN